MSQSIDSQVVSAIRVLSIDQVESANAGHPGLPMGLAPAAYVLFSKIMRHAPSKPHWINRDRFILSAGHGSALIYSLLHLYGYGLEIEELKRFRQLGSKTPGHPEFGHTTGVEMTTGPLGQGISTSVGMALAEAMMAARVDQAGANGLIDHHTYVFASDGDLMEGISHEAASLAGHLKLHKLIVLFDSNNITITGDSHLSCTDDVRKRFEAYGWNYLLVEDHEDLNAIERAFNQAKANTNAPTIIEYKSVIGYGAPNKAGKSSVHGSPLGAAEASAAREFYGWNYGPFEIPEEIYQACKASVAAGEEAAIAWQKNYDSQSEIIKGIVDPTVFTADEYYDAIADFDPAKAVASRVSSKETLKQLSLVHPELVGGSADLAESTGTNLGFDFVDPSNYLGREINFGIREHAMGACLNGMALHGGFKVYGSTFLVFSDYVRPAVRLSAIMNLGVNYVFTHDSIAVGEDGPTHQPIEHLAALRVMPNVRVMRPADANEVAAAWSVALAERHFPSALIFSRQNLPLITPKDGTEWVNRDGCHVVYGADSADIVIFSTGSEVAMCVDAAKSLEGEGISVKVISVLWRERFLDRYRSNLDELTNGAATMVVEAGVPSGWEAVASDENIIAMRSFGASGKGPEVQAHFGFSSENIAMRVKKTLGKA